MGGSSEYEVVEIPAGAMGVAPDAWRRMGRPAWMLELVRRGWRKCPDGTWRYPADWPRLGG